MTKKKAILLSITILFIGLIITAGSYAFWSWSSNTNKNIVFNTAQELRNYIIYDEGESKFAGDFQVSNSYTDGIHSTISLYKTNAASSVDLIATIYMDINAIGNAMRESTALKWKVTQGDSSNPGTTLAQGNFIGVNSGDTLTLVPNIEVTTTLTKYTIWIWIDQNDNPSDDMVGETFDSDIWTEINQAESSDLIYQITRTSANYQTISATVVNNENKIVKYAVTSTNTEPAANSNDWVSIPVANQSKTYNLNTSVNSTGTYYIWFMDEEDNVINAEIEVEDVDTTGPTCTFGNWNKQTVDNNATAQITLTCTDDGSSITNYNLTTSDLTLSNNYVTLTNITKTSITSGYSYQIIVTGTSTDGNITLTLPANKVKNAMHYGNTSVTSSSLQVQNDVTAPTISLESQSSVGYASSYEIPVYITDDITGIASGASVKYGWSTSNNVEPSSYANATLNYVDGALNTTFTAAGSDLDGDYYLWVVPLTLVDKKGNARATPTISSGTFKFDNDTITAPTISFESNVVTNGLIFGFDGRNNTGNGYSSSASTWNNYGSSNTNGTINGATWQDNYLAFDGVDDGVIINEYRTDSYYTVEALVSMNSYVTNEDYILVANFNSGGAGIFVVGGKIRAEVYVSGAYHYAETSWLVDTDRVYAVSGTYDGSSVKLYIDGVLVATNTVSGVVGAPTNSTSFAIGCNPTGSTCENLPYLDGKIYSARIYNRALTDSEVKQNYKADKMSLGEYVNGTPNFNISGGTSTKGISGYQYSLNDYVWGTYNSSSKPTVTIEGETEVHARALNIHSIAGNMSTVEVYLDNTAPTGTLNIGANADTLVATITANDTLSGLREIYGYKVSTNSTCNSTTTGFIISESSEYNFTINSTGQHYVCVRIEDNAGNYNYISELAPSNYYEYTGNYETFTASKAGYYMVETWGAQGGTATGGIDAGAGGYSSGYIYLNQNDNLYIYIGGQGNVTSNAANQTAAGGWNGGGSGFNSSSSGRYGGAGGGATDIRLVSGSWDNATSLNSRIMVAGGGAGTWYYSSSYTTTTAGAGGGLIGGYSSGNDNGTVTSASGGSQISGGTFGAGENGTAMGYPGAGGGYYGGALAYRAAGGGSSFISGYAGSNAITAVDDTTPTDGTLHYSDKYFINGYMSIGTNTGNGKAKITYVGSAPERVNPQLNNVRYIKDCTNGNSSSGVNQWLEIQVIKDGENIAYNKPITGTSAASSAYQKALNGRIDDGKIGSAEELGFQCVIVDLEDVYSVDEVAVWHVVDRAYYDNVTLVSSDGDNWLPIISDERVETSVGKRVNAWEINDIDLSDNLIVDYAYDSHEHTYGFAPPISGYYKIEAWGAQGGTVLYNNALSSFVGGLGGYSSGYIYLDDDEKLYSYVGGKGGDGTTAKRASVGGYNGGGSGDHDNSDDEVCGGGGGATDIRLTSGTWSDAASLNSRIIVAGGGGGGCDVKKGLPGGGLSNFNVNADGFASPLYSPSSQTFGYQFGIGQNGARAATNYPPSGGGGGYYGGLSPASSSNFHLIAGGGTSFISGYAGSNAITSAGDTANPRTHTNNTIHYSDKYFIKSNMDIGTNTGDGKARISYVGAEPQRVNEDLDGVRYIKDCINGNDVNSQNHWIELQAIKNGVNIAKNKTVTGTSPEYNNTTYAYANIVDGQIDNVTATSGFGYTSATGLQCITVDLGDIYDLDEIAVWHYYLDSRNYFDNVTSVSSDNNTWKPVIKNNNYETRNGKRTSAWEPNAAGKYYINYNDNLFVANTGTADGLTVGYDSSTQYLTLNGTWSSTSRILWNNERLTINSGDSYRIKLTYVSGTISTTATTGLVLDLTTNGSRFSDRTTAPVSYTYPILPSSGTNEKTLSVASSRASANGLQYWLYQSSAGATTFTNYVIKVEITKLHSKLVDYEATYGTLETPVKNGHTFLGWYTELNGGTQVTSSTTLDEMSDQTIYAHWRRNKVYIRYHMNGGTWAGSTNTHLSTSNSFVTYDGNNTFASVNFGNTANLADYNSSSYINIKRTGYIAKSGSQWCTGTTGNGTCYNQATNYADAGIDGTASTHFCNARTSDCTITLYVNWQKTSVDCFQCTNSQTYCENTLGGAWWSFNGYSNAWTCYYTATNGTCATGWHAMPSNGTTGCTY